MAQRIKIAKRVVDSLAPTGARYVAWDTEVPGFGVRVAPGGAKTYVLRYRVGGGRGGRERWATIGKHGAITPDQARDLARSWAAEVAGGGDPAGDRAARRAAPTVGELLDRYLAEHVERRNKPQTQRSVAHSVKAIRPALGHLKVADVQRADVARLHASMADRPVAANRALAALSKAFGLAELWGLRPEGTNPCRRVEKYAERGRDRFLSAQEFARLGEVLAAAEAGPLAIEGRLEPVRVNPQAIHAVRLLILTGARVGEVLALRWEFINWPAARAELPDSKTGAKHLHFPPPALEVLSALARPESGRGFVIRGGSGADPERPLVNIKDPWQAIRSAAGLPDVRLHDLRHSYAAAAVAGGMSLPMLGALLGHRSVATTARYAHLSDDPLRDAAARVGGAISGAMQPSPPTVVPLPRKG